MYNKKVLIDSLKKLGSAKAPTKKPDIIYEPKGQLKYPGQNTRIPSEDITMQGVPYPVLGKPNIGQPQMMQPGQNYQFPGADYVDEYPQMKKGGRTKGLVSMPKPSKKGLMSKKYSRSLDATNKFFTQNYLFAKPKSRKNKVFDPNSKYYAEGGESKCQPDEYWDGKKCVKIPKEFKVINDHNEFVYRNKMYGDSLNLFKAYQMQDKLMGPASYKTKDKYKWNTAELKEGRKKKMMPGLTHLVSADFQSEADQFKGGYNAWTARPEDQKLIRYYKSLGFTDKDIMYHSSPDVVSDKIKAVGSYFDGDAVSPIYKKPVQPVVFQEVDKSVVPTTRTVYIDCPPGSVSNDEKTEVITNDPDSPGNYLRTITTGCELEKIENLPIRKPGLIKQEDSELQGADEYNEALENLEAPSYQPVESYNEHFGRTGSLKHKYDIFIPNKLFKMDVGPGGIRYGKRYPIPKFGMKESTMEDPITGETVNKQFRKDRKIQRETGLDRAYYEGSYDEEGNYIPGELENAETEGRRINFEGQYGRKDRKAQEKYNLEYDEYEFRKKFPTLLDELNITYEDYIKKYVPKKQYGGDTDAMNGMMKARLAYANEFGNPAAKRMINIPDNPYQFDNGDIGTHYMASYDNYAVPQIQDENGVLQLGDYGPESNEAIRFDSDEDANYFAENYKDVSPGFLNQKKEGGALHKFIGGGPIDCGEGYEWNEELQECVENTSKYNQQSLAKHLAEKKIYEDALKEIEAGTAEYAILEEAYNAKVKKLEKEKARVLKVRGNVIPASRNLDIADSKINTKNPLYQNFLNASNPKELKLAIKALPQEIKNVLPNQGSYNVAKWDSKTNNWIDGLDPGRELYCTPYGCFAYQKAGASDVPIIGGNIDFANRAATGNFAFEKINPNERQLGDIALMVENAPNDYTDSNSGESRRPHHTTIYAGPDTNAPKDSEKGYFYNADDGARLNFKKSYLATDVTPGDRFDYYRYVGAQNKINDEILDLAKQKEEFNIKQEQRKNNIALPSMATLEPKFITQNNIATLQYPKKEETLKPKNKKLFKKKSFKYGGLNKHEEEGMILDLSPEEIEGYKKGGYIVEEVNDPSIPKLGGFAKGGAQGCPQGTYWNGKKCVDDPFTKGLISQIKKGNKSKKPVPSLTRKAPTQPIPNSWVNSFPSVAEINRQKLKNKQIQNLAEVTITGYKQDFNKVDPEIVPYIYPANTNAARAWEIQKEIFPESVNEINNWYKNWYAGRMENPKFKEPATERYNAAVNGNTPFVLDATPSFQTKHSASLASTYVPKVSDPANLPYQNKIIISNAVAPDGQYNVDYNAKFMNPKISHDYFIQEGIHEKSHWDDNNYPQKGISRANISEDKILNKILPKEYLVPNPQGSVYPIDGGYDENNIYDPNYNGLSEETLSYQARPTEIRARLNVWRKTNNIDPRRNYSVKEIESIINKNIQNARTDDDYRNIIELYKVIRKNPKILKELNDSYVQNDSQQFDQNQLQYGKYGGSLHKFIEGGAEASWPPKGWPPIGNYKGLLGLVKKIPTVNTFGNALKLPAVNWITPSIPTLKREFNVEQVLKNQNFFPDENSFLNAVKNATVQEITPEIDATIGYRSGTTTKEQLLELSKTYASYPQYRNEGTIDAIFDGLKSGAEMEMPMVLQFPNGNKRVFSGNTRMDASRQLGINPNVLMLNVPDMTKLANPWQMEAFPGLQYKSTMLSNPKGLWTQVAKDGTINVENALKSIEKESAGDVKVELLKETLGENIPKKMDFNLFRKKTQETIIPLETTIVDHSSNYGVNKVGYPREKRDYYERTLEADTLEIAEIENYIKNASSRTKQLNSWNDATEYDALQSPMMNQPFDKPIYEAMDPNGFSQYFPTLEEAKQQEEITLRTLKAHLKNTINRSYNTRREMHDLPLENKTVIFSNKDLFGVGSDAHSNPPETLGHIHFLRDADFPDILLATQIQSDPFQSKYYWKYNINNETDALGEEIRRKASNIESRNNDIAQGMVNGLRIENTNYSKEEWEEKKLINLEEINELNNDINVLKEKLEPIVKKYTPNYKQKVLLDKNHKKRFFQEFLNYAANRGDVNYIAIPTVETSARIQNYTPLEPKDQPGPESKLLMDNSNSFEEFVKKSEEMHGLSFQDATEQDKYLLKKGYDLYKKDGTLKGLLNDKRNYKSKHGTVLGNYEEYIKIAKKLGLEIEDVIIKGHTYKKIVIPEDFLKGVGEIDAYKKGGATNKSIEINLTPEEIKKYVNGGYVVEELNDYAGGGSPIWPPGRRKNTTYLTYSPFYGNSLTGQSSNMGYVDNPFSDEESDFFKVNTIRMPQSYIGISGGADPYGRFNHNQGIMQKLGYDAYVGLPYNYDPNNTDYYSNTPSVGGRIRYNNSINNRWLGIPWNKVFVEASGDYSQSDGLNANFSLGTRFDGKKGKTKGYFEPHVGVSGSFGPHGIKPGAYSANALAQYQILTQSNDIPDLESDAINMSDPAIQVLLSDIYNEGIENPLAKGKKQQGAMADIDLGFKTGFEWSPNFLTKHLPGSKIFGDLRYTAQPIRGMFVSGMGENSQSNYGTYNGVETSLSDQSETNKLSFAHQFTGGLGLKVPIGTVKDKIQNIDFTNIRIPKDCMCPDGTKVDKLEDGSCPCDDHQIEECPPCPDGSVPRRLKDGTCPCEKIESYPDPDEWARNPRWLKDGGVSYELGDEVDEDTMKTLKKLGYTFNKI